jgi:hypothetical protein
VGSEMCIRDRVRSVDSSEKRVILEFSIFLNAERVPVICSLFIVFVPSLCCFRFAPE